MARVGLMKFFLGLVLLTVVRRSVGQGNLNFVALPCETDTVGDPNPNDPMDNLSCPSSTLSADDRCLSREQVCNNMMECPGNEDEGDMNNNVDLDCDGTRSGSVGFFCDNTRSISDYTQLCDGIADCDDGGDETRVICENKCLGPYYGGCAYTRQCLTSTSTRICGLCLDGFISNPNNISGCLIEIGLDFVFYSGSETAQTTGMICARFFVNDAQTNGGLEGAFLSLAREEGPGFVDQINAVITSRLLTPPDASNLDFGIASQPVTLSSTQPTDCVTFTIADDNIVENVENFEVFITTSTSFATIRPTRSSATVQIIDNDQFVEARYDPTTYVVDETNGTVFVYIIIISRSPGFTVLTADSTVTPSFIGGDATDGSDYLSSPTPTTLTFPAGTAITTDPATTARLCFSFPILNDNFPENTETVMLGIGGSSGLVDPNALTSTATVSIINDDVAEVSLDMSSYTVNEEDMNLRVFAQIVNGVIVTSPFEVTVTTLARAAGPTSATANVDYDTTMVTLTFEPGNQGPMPVDIPIDDDTILESSELFDVQLLVLPAFSNIARTTPPSLSPVTILDNDAIRFAVNIGGPGIPENSDALVTVTPIDFPIPGPNPLIFTLSTGAPSDTATEDFDYTGIDGVQLTFPVGSSAPMTVPIIIDDDLFIETDETFTVTVIAGDPRVTINGVPILFTGELQIIDNDRIEFAFTQAAYTVIENMGPLVGGVQLTMNSGIPLSTFTAEVTTGTGSAGSGDFVALNSFQVNFNPLSTPGTTIPFDVNIIDDLDPENQETFPLSLDTDDNTAVNVGNSATGIIIDNDPIRVGFVLPSITVDEEMMPGVVDLCIEITSPGPIPRDAVVNFNTADGTATAAMDYVAIPSRSVQFDAGSDSGDTECVTVTIINDNVLEMTGETFTGVLTSTTEVVIDRDTTTVVFVESNDQVECNFVPATYTTDEDDTTVMVCITCNTNTLSSPIIITVISTGGSAMAPDDFAAVNQQLTFSAGSMTQCVPVVIEEDTYVENKEEIMLTAFGTSLPTGVSIGTGSATICIIDDDIPFVGIVTPNPPPIPEDDGPAMVCVEISNGVTLHPGSTITVNIATSDGTAMSPGDYLPVDMSMIFNSANSAGMLCFNITINDDLLCEDTEFFFVGLTSPDAVVIVPSATIRIADNDRAEVALVNLEPDMFVDGVYHVTECSDEVLSFDISITNSVRKGPGVTCAITVTTEDDTAEAGSDYEALSATCILYSNNSECDFQIGIIDDYTAEMTESFYIRLSSNDTTRCYIANDHITVNITDDEDCDDDVCDDFEICEELMCPNNFTCVPTNAVGDDPHFAVTLSSGKTLCYTVQGEHGFAFNLISNKKVYMNAMFVPDKDREEVTWLGTMGIVVANSNGFKKSNMTRLRFEAIKNKIHIDDQMVLEARNIEKITIKNGKLTISEAPPTEGYKQPFVRVDLVDVQLSFSIKFMTEHLDLYWHSTGQNVEDSHGIIGQFFRNGVELDSVRKILMMPGKEPVPVQRKPIWAFMEREYKDNDNFCWMAMNPGFQGEGLIDGKYFDYLVDDVLSTEFKFKKL